MKHGFHPEAEQELLAATHRYLEEAGLAVAEQFERRVQRAVRLLTAMPQLGRPLPRDIRTWPVKTFPYTLVYRLREDVITVIAVAHQSREPRYWQGR